MRVQIGLPCLLIKLPEKCLEFRLLLRLDLLRGQLLRGFRLLGRFDLCVDRAGVRLWLRIFGRGGRRLSRVVLSPACGDAFDARRRSGIAVDDVLHNVLRQKARGEPLMTHGRKRGVDIDLAPVGDEGNAAVGREEIKPLQTENDGQKNSQLFQRLFLLHLFGTAACEPGCGAFAAE